MSLIFCVDGRISDAFGRKTTLAFAAIVFFAGSFFCGAADSMWTLVAARVVAGIGGGGLNTVTAVIWSLYVSTNEVRHIHAFQMSSVITSDLVSLRERGKYQGYANICYAVSKTEVMKGHQ